VKWVETSPDYPPSLAPLFEALQSEGTLRPIASADFDTLVGSSRIYGQRVTVKVTILEVTN
jgi:hypothetical protein